MACSTGDCILLDYVICLLADSDTTRYHGEWSYTMPVTSGIYEYCPLEEVSRDKKDNL